MARAPPQGKGQLHKKACLLVLAMAGIQARGKATTMLVARAPGAPGLGMTVPCSLAKACPLVMARAGMQAREKAPTLVVARAYSRIQQGLGMTVPGSLAKACPLLLAIAGI